MDWVKSELHLWGTRDPTLGRATFGCLGKVPELIAGAPNFRVPRGQTDFAGVKNCKEVLIVESWVHSYTSLYNTRLDNPRL
jgi:hypothetical protein